MQKKFANQYLEKLNKRVVFICSNKIYYKVKILFNIQNIS